MITIPGKIPIRIHPIFWVFVLVISALSADSPFKFVCWVSIIIVSVIFHEMGHALTAVAFGQRAHIDLVGFGGLTHRHGKPLSAWKDFLIVFNGPLASLILCAVSYYLLTLQVNYSPNGLFALRLFLTANLFWTAINLIPVQPLDGGHLLRIALEGLFGLKGLKIALFISLFLAVAAAIAFFSYNLLIGGVIFMMLTFENYRAWRSSLDMTAADQSRPLQQLMREAQDDCLQGNEEAALKKLARVRAESEGGMLSIGAALLAAEVLNKQGKAEEAYATLNPLRGKLPANPLRFLQDLAFQTHRWGDAIAIGTLAYQAEPHYETAVLNALSHAQLREAQPAVGWLRRAIGDGLPHIDNILGMREFDPIRSDPLFQNVAKTS